MIEVVSMTADEPYEPQPGDVFDWRLGGEWEGPYHCVNPAPVGSEYEIGSYKTIVAVDWRTNDIVAVADKGDRDVTYRKITGTFRAT